MVEQVFKAFVYFLLKSGEITVVAKYHCLENAADGQIIGKKFGAASHPLQRFHFP
jgi:hypothetical protein